MAFLAFENSIRLHIDSINLFKNKSYPTAFFLSVIAIEEFGKMHLIGEAIFQDRFNGPNPKSLIKFSLRDMHDHASKQFWFAKSSNDLPTHFAKSILLRELEPLKQKSLYVGFEGKKGFDIKQRISSPFSLARATAQKQISITHVQLNDFIHRTSIEKSDDSYFVNNACNWSRLQKMKRLWGHKVKGRFTYPFALIGEKRKLFNQIEEDTYKRITEKEWKKRKPEWEKIEKELDLKI